MISQSGTPADVAVIPRNRLYDLGDCLARDWFDAHPFKTAWFNAMSITFPLGEKFFIDSVRYFSDRIEDRALQQEIGAFSAQEGFHRREHERYNRALCAARGYDLAYLERRLVRRLEFTLKWFSPLQQLAMTAATEHITAIMAELALAPVNPMMSGAELPIRKFWEWHAAEESEHKSVAFDVFRAVGGGEAMRRRWMVLSAIDLLIVIVGGVVHMLRRDGTLWNRALWRDGWRFLFGSGGILRRIWPAFRAYFAVDFHPWQRETRHLLVRWRAADTAA